MSFAPDTPRGVLQRLKDAQQGGHPVSPNGTPVEPEAAEQVETVTKKKTPSKK